MEVLNITSSKEYLDKLIACLEPAVIISAESYNNACADANVSAENRKELLNKAMKMQSTFRELCKAQEALCKALKIGIVL